MEVLNYIIEEKLILIPVLYTLAEIIKMSKVLKNKYIPLTLLVFGIGLSVAMGHDSLVDNIIQGILVTGATVLTNQVIKQSEKEE